MIYVLLGLLMLKNMSQYEMKKVLAQPVSPFYKGSMGSIQRALAKLETNELIKKENDLSSKRKKYIYSITELGKKTFIEWMLEAPNETKFDSEISTKIFFLGLLTNVQQKVVLDNAIKFTEKTLNEYEAYYRDMNHEEFALNKIAKFQVKTLEMGLLYFKEINQWLIGLRKEIA